MIFNSRTYAPFRLHHVQCRTFGTRKSKHPIPKGEGGGRGYTVFHITDQVLQREIRVINGFHVYVIKMFTQRRGDSGEVRKADKSLPSPLIIRGKQKGIAPKCKFDSLRQDHSLNISVDTVGMGQVLDDGNFFLISIVSEGARNQVGYWKIPKLNFLP